MTTPTPSSCTTTCSTRKTATPTRCGPRAALAHNFFLYDMYHDSAPKIDGYADFAQGDSHGDDEPPAQIDVDDEPEQIDVIAAFAQSGSDGVEPRQHAPKHAYHLPRPVPEGYDEGYFDLLDYEPPMPGPDLAEPEPVETHEWDIRSDAASTAAPCAIPLCPEKVPPIDDFFDGFVTHHLGFDGYRVVDGRRVQERDQLQCHNVLVVDGLKKDIILLSVRDLLERDDVKTYFNSAHVAGDAPPLNMPSTPEAPDEPAAAESPPAAYDVADAFFGKVVNEWCDDKLTELTWLDEGPGRIPTSSTRSASSAPSPPRRAPRTIRRGPQRARLPAGARPADVPLAQGLHAHPGSRVVLTGQTVRLWKRLIRT